MDAFLIAFVFFYFWHTFGISIGYHRLLTHRAVQCVKPLEYFFVIGGYLALEGSPVWWACMHRAHHRYADTDLDPHTPRKGIKYAYNGWLGKRDYPDHLSPQRQCSDIINDPLYSWLEQDGHLRKASQLCFWLNVGFRVLLLFTLGPAVAIASLLAAIISHQQPLIINTVCHLPDRFGYRNFDTKDDSINVWWLAVATVGESWHNNHHTFPGSAKFGLKAHEFDASWVLLKMFQSIGLVKKINQPRIEMKQELNLKMDHVVDPTTEMPADEAVAEKAAV
ncbi:MAG: fatty acid desaturase [Candidatus Obscuribacterales bacterium]|nr:fatty acid desaturase [Candidatus Obscuribacterales bacterium]